MICMSIRWNGIPVAIRDAFSHVPAIFIDLNYENSYRVHCGTKATRVRCCTVTTAVISILSMYGFPQTKGFNRIGKDNFSKDGLFDNDNVNWVLCRTKYFVSNLAFLVKTCILLSNRAFLCWMSVKMFYISLQNLLIIETFKCHADEHSAVYLSWNIRYILEVN